MSQIAGFNPVDAALQSRTGNRFSDMSTEDFVRIIFTELSNQDPFQPNDSSALLEQLNSIRSIESDLSLIEKLESLVQENQLASASNLIGRTVTGLSEDLTRVSGRVLSVQREGDAVFLELESGRRIPIDSVETIEMPSAPA